MHMRKLTLFVLLLAAACVQQEWTRPGVTEAELLSDTDQCQADANTKVPINLAPVGSYVWASPTTPLSNFNGTIPSGLGSAYNGDQTNVDTNQDARDKIFRDCMTGHGYSLATSR